MKPRISVIVCTHDRPAMLARALESVLSQDVDDFEVVVVDDGSDPPATVAPHPKIRLVRTPHRGVGAARAEGLNAARGDLIAYCDDDDEWSPDHLRQLSRYLDEHSEVDLVYADSDWIEEGEQPTVGYSFDFDAAQMEGDNFVFASDVLHRAEAARRAGGFDPTLKAFEDWDLWLRMSLNGRLRHLPLILGKHYWHEGVAMAGDIWQLRQKVYEAHQQRLSSVAPAVQHDFADTSAKPIFDRIAWEKLDAFDPRSWTERRELICQVTLRVGTGFGRVGRHLVQALARNDVSLTIPETKSQVSGFESYFHPVDSWDRIGFYYDYRLHPSVMRCRRLVNYSMWDSTIIPRDHVQEINRSVSLQYVPCQHNVETFQAAGLRVPIKVLHHGVDASEFPYLVRDPGPTFTFGSFGDFSVRKGIDVLIKAFQAEFGPKEPVRLVLKSTEAPPPYVFDDPRIELISGVLSNEGLLEWLRRLNAFVLPSRGEGFGLCGLEAMSTGLPLIATNWSGPREYLDPSDSFPIDYRLVDAGGARVHNARYTGVWAEPDRDHLQALMRWLYEHPDKAARRGRLASQRVHRDWTWDRVAHQICEDLDELARS